ncbi:cation:proton antiporter regulatory subunit [Streptomyces sp. MMCC 100]|uniref:cation:proton antiporter regulatory subunit n=1 Tax=Streptomyces sp. MMCC 100 TaxID=3163555 RepID=UPI003596F3E9
MRSPLPRAHRRLLLSQIRSTYGVTVVGIKRPGEDFTYATADTVVQADDVIVVTGKTRAVETFADLS